MKLAAIDIGSNSVHMIVAQIDGDGQLDIIDRTKEMVRLGERSLTDGYLSEAAQERGIRTLRRFRRLAEDHGVDDIIAVATSAVRESRNGHEFIARVGDDCGIAARVITGEEEARLIYLGAREVFDFGRQVAVLIDIGGGSVEFILADRRRERVVCSLKLGVRRLHEEFLPSDPPTADEVDALRAHVRAAVEPVVDRVALAGGYDLVLGTSGTARVLGKIVASRAGGPADIVKQADLLGLIQHLVTLRADQRSSVPGLDDKRRDAIVEGAVLMHTLVEAFGSEHYQVVDAALREGMIVDYLERNRGDVELLDREPDPRRRSVVMLARRLSPTGAHAQHVALRALRLFDDLRALHEGTEAERELTEFAGLLHDVGRSISGDAFHKHTLYVLLHADLTGFSEHERLLLANLARYHRRSAPKSRHEHYMALGPEARERVKQLALLLRLANSLDRGHRGRVNALSARVEGDALCIQFRCEDDPALEVSSLQQHAGVVQTTLGLRLVVDAFCQDAEPLPTA